MISTLSKKTITKQAETIQKTSHIRHMQALDIVAEKNGFKNYQHFKETKKYKIAVFSRKGGVGKTTTSLGLYKDLDADCYYRTDFTMGRSEYKYCQIFPKVVKNSNLKPKKGLSAIYDLCRYTNLNDIDDILNDVNLFILPAKSHELQGAYKSVHTNTIKDISKYNKPIIIFSHGEYTPQKKKNLEILKNLEIELKEELFPANPLDRKNAIVEIRAGTGGDESALFAAEIFRMYTRFAERQGWKVNVLDSSQNGIGGYKEVTFTVEGDGVYGLLKYEGGTHRVQRVPETEKAGRVHTSTITVAVFPEAEEVDIEIKAADIRIDTFCSSGPGGQSVNTTYSAIRILHIPTGMIVSCQDQKSQHQNKEKALQVLRSRLLQKMEDEKRAADSSARKEMVGGGDRSDKIRTYNFPQDRITDHRINQNWHSIKLVMEGELDPIIYALKDFANNNKTSA